MGNEINAERLKLNKRLIRCSECKHGNCYTGDDYTLRVNCQLYPMYGLSSDYFCASGEAKHGEAHI